MNNLLKFEEAAMFGLSIYLFSLAEFEWWWYPVLILAPDLSMLGYIVNPRIGGIIYKIFHLKATGVILIVGGWQLGIAWMLLAGIILFGHSSMDRIFGYGLKYFDDFKNTHLGRIG